jgi:predicted naringenin-chalcone synthase
VTHSCTGWRAPGISFELIDRLKISLSIRRIEVNFMGCFGASTALYVSKNIVDSDPRAVSPVPP